MKVLISAGSGSHKLVEIYNNAFRESIEFDELPYLRDIDEYLGNGNTFDRLLVFEQSLTENGMITDASAISDVLARLTELMDSQLDKQEVIAVANTAVIADYISMQMFMNESRVKVILFSESKYKVALLKALAYTAFNEIENDRILGSLVYKNNDSKGIFEEDSSGKGTTSYNQSYEEDTNEDAQDDFGESSDMSDILGDESEDTEHIKTETHQNDSGDSLNEDADFGTPDTDLGDGFGQEDGKETDFGFGDGKETDFDFGDADFGEDADGDLGFGEEGDGDLGFGDEDLGFGEDEEGTDFGFGDADFREGDEDLGFGEEDLKDEDSNSIKSSDINSDNTSEVVSDSEDNTELFGAEDGLNDTESGVENDSVGDRDTEDSNSENSNIDFGFGSEDNENNNINFTQDNTEENIISDTEEADSDNLFGEDTDSMFGEDNSAELFGEEDSTEEDNDTNTEEDTEEKSVDSITESDITTEVNTDTDESTEADLFSNDEEIDEETITESDDENSSDNIELFGEDNTQQVPAEEHEFEDSNDSLETQETVQEESKKKKGLFGLRGRKKSQSAPRKVTKEKPSRPQEVIRQTPNDLANVIERCKIRGNLMVFTGTGDSGTSTLVANLANVLSQVYRCTVLVVDLDLNGRTHSYMNLDSYNNINSVDPDSSNIRACINKSGADLLRYTTTVRMGYNLLTSGYGCDFMDAQEIVGEDRRFGDFLRTAKATYNFVLVDVKFSDAVTAFKELMLDADTIIVNMKPNTKDVMQFTLNMCNIDDSQVRQIMFNRAGLLFNRVTNNNMVLGKRVSGYEDMLNTADKLVTNISGYSPELRKLRIVSEINEYEQFNQFMFTDKFVSDTPMGRQIFENVLYNILTVY